MWLFYYKKGVRHRYMQKILMDLDIEYCRAYVYPIAYRDMTAKYRELVRKGRRYMSDNSDDELKADDEDNMPSETDEFEVIFTIQSFK